MKLYITIVILVDERLDECRFHLLLLRLFFGALTETSLEVVPVDLRFLDRPTVGDDSSCWMLAAGGAGKLFQNFQNSSSDSTP